MAYQPQIYGMVSSGNSTTSNLTGGAVFTGTGEEVLNYSSIKIYLLSTHPSATDGLALQFSTDNVTWETGDAYTITAATTKTFKIGANARYFRVVYTNGATTTTNFKIQTTLHTSHTRSSAQRPSDGRSNENDFDEVLNYMNFFNGVSGAWDRLRGSGGAIWTTKPTPLFKGRAQTFRTPGRAGTAGQKLMSIHNATGSAISLQINKITVDMTATVIKAVTVLPPIIRMWKVTVVPTQGTVLAKTKIGGTTTSSASVDVRGDASADGTLSGTALTATLPTGTFISQEFAPRLITAVGYEMSDRIEFFGDTEVILGPLEGIVVHLDYVLATQNPATDMWIVGMEWEEKTP